MTERALIDPALVRIMDGPRQIDADLPSWARRSNPIVRRQLGIYWKTLPLEIGLWLRLLAIQAGVVLLAVPFPVLYTFIMPIVTVSVLLVPMAFALYAQVLYHVAVQSTTAVYDEQRNNTLALLRVTPLPLRHILFSKVAAAIWRQLDNLGLVIAAHVLLGLPILVLQYAGSRGSNDEPLLTALVIILALAACLPRLLLEPIFVGAIGLMVGASTTPRILAQIVSVALAAAYFAFLNAPRLLEMSWTARVLVEIVLPLVLPAVLAWLALMAATYFVRRD